jgi:serine/threonine-protein kinase RsbT
LARNVFLYAGSGVVRYRVLNGCERVGIELIVEDHGPGIADIDQAMQPGYTSGRGLGLGLPGAKRLMDEMEIESEAGKGTKITVKKWRKGT